MFNLMNVDDCLHPCNHRPEQESIPTDWLRELCHEPFQPTPTSPPKKESHSDIVISLTPDLFSSS